MTNDNDTIRALLDRFMSGETSREEERRLAQWFRDHPKVADDLEDYRLMFAYFDEGMPRQDASRRRKPWLYAALAAAASLALAVTLVRPGAPVPSSPVAMTRPATHADTLATPPAPALQADTLPMKEETDKRPMRYRRHRFTPAPPKVLLAEVIPEAEPLRVSVPTEEPQCEEPLLAAAPMTDAERQAMLAQGNRQADEALRQLELAQRQFLEEAMDSLNNQLASAMDDEENENDVY